MDSLKSKKRSVQQFQAEAQDPSLSPVKNGPNILSSGINVCNPQLKKQAYEIEQSDNEFDENIRLPYNNVYINKLKWNEQNFNYILSFRDLLYEDVYWLSRRTTHKFVTID